MLRDCKSNFKENNFESMTYDFVKDSKGKWVLLEISHLCRLYGS